MKKILILLAVVATGATIVVVAKKAFKLKFDVYRVDTSGASSIL